MGVNQFTKQQNITSNYLDISQNARTAIEIQKEILEWLAIKIIKLHMEK